MGEDDTQSCHGFKLAPCVYFLTSIEMARACWEVWNVFSNTDWPSSLKWMTVISTKISCFISCFLVLLALLSTLAVNIKSQGLAASMWWIMYLTTLIDGLNNVAYLSIIGFGMHPFIVQCIGGDKKEAICENHQCSLWGQCTQVWQMSMTWIAVTTAASFLINCIFIYCLHIARRKPSDIKAKPQATLTRDDQYKMRQPYSSSFFDYNRPPRLAPLNPHHSPYDYH